MTRSLDGLVYEPVPGFEDHLEKELTGGWTSYGPFYFVPNDPPEPRLPPTEPRVFWRRNVWRKPFILEFDSISRAASALREIQRNWAPSLFTRFRRGTLIAEKLPPLPEKPRPFPWLPPDTPMGAWTLLDDRTILASAECVSPFPGGIIRFEEDKQGPPSRAYLKLWEALTLAGRRPAPGDLCLDAGASPGGWTWALAKLGARVTAVDRSPLSAPVAAMDGVRFIKHDAFTLKPEETGRIDWLFCDAACYPSRLFDWVERWLASGFCENYVCTIKMQGGPETADFDTPRRFAAIPGSKVVHLYHNKHELTYIRTATNSGFSGTPRGSGGDIIPRDVLY
jgi:23S rRNA (cytidine2498-2'-O)-methyltransferase